MQRGRESTVRLTERAADPARNSDSSAFSSDTRNSPSESGSDVAIIGTHPGEHLRLPWRHLRRRSRPCHCPSPTCGSKWCASARQYQLNSPRSGAPCYRGHKRQSRGGRLRRRRLRIRRRPCRGSACNCHGYDQKHLWPQLGSRRRVRLLSPFKRADAHSPAVARWLRSSAWKPSPNLLSNSRTM